MTTAANTRRNDIVATAGQTVFSYTFEVAAAADLVVEQEGVVLTLTTHYTVSGVGAENGGSVTLVTGATLDDAIAIYSNEAIARPADYATAGDFKAGVVNAEMDKVFRLLGDLELALSRTIRLDDNDPTAGSSFTMGTVAARATKYLAMTSDGKLTFTSGTENAFIVSAFAETFLDDVDASAVLSTLGVSAFIKTLLDDADQATARATLGAAADTLRGWTLIDTQTLSADDDAEWTDLAAGVDHGFELIELVPNADRDFKCETSADTGASPTYDQGGSDYESTHIGVVSGDYETNTGSSTSMELFIGNTTAEQYVDATADAGESVGFNGFVWLEAPVAGVTPRRLWVERGTYQPAASNACYFSGMAQRKAAAAINAVRFYFGTHATHTMTGVIKHYTRPVQT